jgi:hypothetical protein
MSSFAAGYLSTLREAAPSGTSTGQNPPGIKTYIDALAALVPAEVLIGHGVILASATQLTVAPDGKSSTAITDPAALRVAFWGLAVIAIFAYLSGRIVAARSTQKAIKWDRWDVVRALIPALAFVGWTMLQSPTAFDALALNLTGAMRVAIAVIGGGALGGVASLLAYQLDAK